MSIALSVPSHDVARLGAVLLHVRSVARQSLQYFGRHAPASRRRRHHRAADRTLAVAGDIDKGLAVEGQRHRPAQFGVVERRLVAVDQHLPRDVPRHHLANRFRFLALQFLHQRQCQDALGVAVEFTAGEGQDRGRGIGDEGVFDAVEIGPVLFPVIRVAGDLDRLVGLEFDEFERAGADRFEPHIARRHMTGIDRRPARGQQGDEGRLRPLQVEGHLVIVIDADPFEVAVPGSTRVDPQLLSRGAGDHFPGAFDVLGGERLAVVPFDTLAQFEGQRLAVFVIIPALRQIGGPCFCARAGPAPRLAISSAAIKLPTYRRMNSPRRYYRWQSCSRLISAYCRARHLRSASRYRASWRGWLGPSLEGASRWRGGYGR